MYTPPQFKIATSDAIDTLIRENGFATLICVTADGLEATHTPLVLHGSAKKAGRLQGHLARANPLGNCLDGQPVLAIFQGAHGYISPRLYKNPSVPTWNYIAVHCRGTARLMADEASREAHLGELVEQYEGSAWMLEEMEKERLAQLKKAITPFEISIDNVEAKAKLSQNKSDGNRHNIIATLQKGTPSDAILAEAMQRWAAP